MKARIALGVSLAALVLPGLANAASVKGVVVAKESVRHVLVVASARGTVTTLRVDVTQLAKVRIGTRVGATGTAQADGSLLTTKLFRLGHAGKARIHVVVVKVAKRRLLVAGGGSAFSIKLTRGTRVLADAGPSLQPGDQVETEVELDNGVVSSTVQQLGQATLIEFSGVVTSLDSASLQITSNGIVTTVQLPSGVTLPPLVAAGARVEVVASVSGSTLTLSMIKVEDQTSAGDGSQGVEVSDNGEAKVEGTVTAVTPDSITIQAGDGAAPVTFAIPAGLSLPTLAVGDRVEARGTSVAGVLTLAKIEVNGGGGQDGSGSGSGDSGGSQAGSGGDTGSGDSGSSGSGDSGSSGGDSSGSSTTSVDG